MKLKLKLEIKLYENEIETMKMTSRNMLIPRCLNTLHNKTNNVHAFTINVA